MAKGIYKRGNIFWIRYAGLDGRIVRESSGSEKFKAAEDLLIKKKNAIKEGKQPEETRRLANHTFKELSAEYSKWAERQRGYKQKANILDQLNNVFGAYPLRAFSTRLLEGYQTERIQKGNKPATINRHLATIKHMFTKAVQWEMVEESIMKKVRQVKLLEENNRRLRFLSKDECKTLIAACDLHLKPIVVTAMNTGMRKGEILGLKWDHVDLKHGFIFLDRTKNGERREIPINDTLRAALHGITRRLDVPHVFYDSSTGKAYQDVKRSFGSALKKVDIHKCPDCGCQKPAVRIKNAPVEKCPHCGVTMAVTKGIQDFHFHDLRHTFASHLVMAGVDLTTVSRLLGHKSLTMTLRYSHLAPSHMVKAVDILDSTLNEKPTAQLVHKKEVVSHA